MKQDDFLVEILTEELPPKALHQLGEAFYQQVTERLRRAEVGFNESESKWFATPRRLAVFIRSLMAAQPEQIVERRGPAVSAAYNEEGKPTPACIGFAKSCGVKPEDLTVIKNHQGEWLGYSQHLPGKTLAELMPVMVEQSVQALPVPKYMRWGDSDISFARPVHAVAMLYGDQLIEGTVLACETGRVTRGHRFMSPGWITIPTASVYESLMETEGKVIVDFHQRRAMIEREAIDCVHQQVDKACLPIMNEALLDEVAGLVEWPVALCGQFDKIFLAVPQEALVSAMEDHQRYFPVTDGHHLQAYFVVISNIQSSETARVVHGNERVLRARLSDAAFFFETDKKEKLIDRLQRLKNIVYQAKLGTLYDKAERLQTLAEFIAEKINANSKEAARAALLAKTDLTTQMVGEFPELQGIMGCYYARHDGESENVAIAIQEHYLPRFSGDRLPVNPIGTVLALADKIDALAGAFTIDQLPTGDKDPYGLRRAAIGIIRMLVEGKINIDLKSVFTHVLNAYSEEELAPRNAAELEVINQKLLLFMQERMRSWYLDKGISADVLAAVFVLDVSNPLDIDKRVKAVQAFKQFSEAEALSIANKRVSNILQKQTPDSAEVDSRLFEHDAERVLLADLEQKQKAIQSYCEKGDYEAALKQLAELRQPVDDFFDHVMVMAGGEKEKNRLILLSKLRKLFLQVADIALLR